MGASTAGAALGCARPNSAIERQTAQGIQKGTLDRIGLQLYTVRRDMQADFDRTLSRVAAIGYKAVEFAGYFGRSPASVRATLHRNGLTAPSAHIGTAAALRSGLEKTIEDARIIGHNYLVVAFLDAEDRRTLDDYRRVADLLNAAGATARDAGLRLGYHNHDFEFAAIEGRIPYDILLERTNSALVAMEMDLYWVTKGGQSPLDYIARHPGRFELVHVKDMDASPQQQIVDVGRGTIDFPRIFAQRQRAGIQHFFVERDNAGRSAIASAQVSYDYLAALKF